MPHTPQVYTQVSFDGHQTTPAAVDGVVPASAPAFSSAIPANAAAAANSLNNGAALNTFSSVRGASSDSGRGEYVQESDITSALSSERECPFHNHTRHKYVAKATYSD